MELFLLLLLSRSWGRVCLPGLVVHTSGSRIPLLVTESFVLSMADDVVPNFVLSAGLDCFSDATGGVGLGSIFCLDWVPAGDSRRFYFQCRGSHLTALWVPNLFFVPLRPLGRFASSFFLHSSCLV